MSPRIGSSLVARLFDRSRAAEWGVSREQFQAALEASVAHAFAGKAPAAADVERYAQALHLEDLALACACEAGHDAAWEHFVRQHRPVLYRAADAIDPSGGARDLADALYADLFGLKERQGERQSLLRYFHGRSSLATWLRAVLSQRHIDRLRRDRRLDPLPDDAGSAAEAALASPPGPGTADPDRPRHLQLMQLALRAAIAALAPRDRLRLSLYYAQDMTLAAIGRALKEHEATASRHLTRTREAIRSAVHGRLREEHGLDDRAIEECFASVVDDAGSMDVGELMGARKKAAQDRSI